MTINRTKIDSLDPGLLIEWLHANFVSLMTGKSTNIGNGYLTHKQCLLLPLYEFVIGSKMFVLYILLGYT